MTETTELQALGGFVEATEYPIEYSIDLDCYHCLGRVLHMKACIDEVEFKATHNYPTAATFRVEDQFYRMATGWGDSHQVDELTNISGIPNAQVMRLVLAVEDPLVQFLYLGEQVENLPEEDPPATPEVPKGDPEDFEAEFFGKP